MGSIPSDVSPNLANRLRSEIAGEVKSDIFSRGRYATDASFYQIMPAAVAMPKSKEDIAAAIAIAGETGLSVTPRGAGTSQCGQTVNSGIILDFTRHLNRLVEVDEAARTCVVEPGIALDDLNRALAPTGLWFPVDISTASRATLGGMAGNNACGTRSLRYGIMRDHVSAIEAVMADGTERRFGDRISGDGGSDGVDGSGDGSGDGLLEDLFGICAGVSGEIDARFPKVQRRVGGYNLDALVGGAHGSNVAELLVGSEGTLAVSTRLTLKLSPRLKDSVIGICHFGSFRAAMEAAQHLVALGPVALELMDRTMIELGRNIPLYRSSLDSMIRGEPAAVLLAEFSEGEAENRRRLDALEDAMGELGIGWDQNGSRWGGVSPITQTSEQAALREVRQAGLNIMMSMKEAGKPVSFIEDCAVPLEHLADYTEQLSALFKRHGTYGTWYAHASEGCLHVRPVLNLKLEQDVATMRQIAEAAFELVRDYRGSHSGEHGDGIVRSEFHRSMFGGRIVGAFEAVKDRMDPAGLLNPGKITRPPAMDDRRLMRYGPHYTSGSRETALAWADWPGGLQGAVEMCNNNGACRKSVGGVMCPSFRATREEQHSVRGRANSLRLALSGQLGKAALESPEMSDAMSLCVSCKACKRECPTGVDMARMKIEVLAARAQANGLTLRDRIIGNFPKAGPYLATMPFLLSALDHIPGMRAGLERGLGITARRSLPHFSRRPFATPFPPVGPENGPRVALFADSFNRWLEPEVLTDALTILTGLGYRVVAAGAPKRGEHLCCGRTHLAVGDVDRARRKLSRIVETLYPLAAQGIPILGLEPSCLLTLRDELIVMIPGERSETVARQSMLVEEFLAKTGTLTIPGHLAQTQVRYHSHCHQKSLGGAPESLALLKAIPGVDAGSIDSGCCGMAGAFGYQSETYDVSMRMGELGLLPAVREAPGDSLIAASGTSCRQQIRHGTGREALHPVQIVARAMATSHFREY